MSEENTTDAADGAPDDAVNSATPSESEGTASSGSEEAAAPETEQVASPDPTVADDAAPNEDTSATTRRTTAAGAAASRARRIGGRLPTVPGNPVNPSAPSPDEAPADDTGATTVPRNTSTASDRSADDPEATVTLPKRGPAAQGTPFRSQRQVLLTWTPAAVLAIAAVVFGVLVIIRASDSSGESSNATRDQVLAAAKTCLAATNTYKYNDLATFEKKGLACATGEFAKEFKSSVEDILKKNAPAVKQVQSLQVNASGITDITDHNQWDLLVYGQTSITNTSSANEIQPFGAVLRMQQVNGKWLISSLCSQTYNGSASRCY